MNSKDEWNEQERNAFDELKREIDPGTHFEERLWRRLRQSGAFKPPASASSGRRWILQAVAALALFALGLAFGTWMQSPASPQGAQRYMLLLFAGNGPVPSTALTQRIAEYGQWAEELRQQGRFVTGERLAPDGPFLPAGQAGGRFGQLQGYFVIGAPSAEAALAAARTHPHLGYGGRIAVRQVLSSD